MQQHGKLTCNEALALLSIEKVPGGDEMCEVMIAWVEYLMGKNGADWVAANRKRLIQRLKEMSED